MAYKTVLVHLHKSERVPVILNAAVQLAERHQAHLIGLHTSFKKVLMGAAVGYEISAGMHEQFQGLQEEEAARIKSAYEAAKAKLKTATIEWRSVSADTIDTIFDEVIRQSRHCDITVADGKPHTDPMTAWSDMPVRLIMESGRPVLLVPAAFTGPAAGERVLIAWNGKREAARAVFDALPVLRRAQSVTVLTILTGGARDRTLPESAAQLARTLVRHGVQAESRPVNNAEQSDAECLLSSVVDFGCDMLIMGCYGHSRFREMVFGGVTKHVFAHLTVPVITSH